jgi:4-amino-4-deoxy-L-arabinose transferase-like glycosyltransferase
LTDDKNMSTKSPSTSARTLWLLLLAFAILWGATLGSRALLHPDEGRYAEIAREMLASGDWITPRLNGIKYFEKPALQYWATAVAFMSFGENEFAARFWCGLTGLLGVLLAYYVGARLYGREAGMMAAVILGSSLLYFILGHLNTLDMGLGFFLEVALAGFLLAQTAAVGSSSERRWMLASWLGIALALMSKGIVALVLPAFTLVLYHLAQREWPVWSRWHLVPGLALMLVVAAPWFIAVSLANPEFPGFFFVHEHFARFLTTVHRRDEPWWFFGPVLLAGALPWTALWLQSISETWRTAHGAHFHTRRFLLLWIVANLVFFSLSHSKLPPYIVPVMPAIAWLLGDFLTRIRQSSLGKQLAAMSVFWIVGAIVLVFIKVDATRSASPEVIAAFRPWAVAGFALAGGASVVAWWTMRRRPIWWAVAIVGIGTLAAQSVLLQGFDAFRATRSGLDLANSLRQYDAPDKSFYSVGVYEQTLPFYLRRTMTLVDYRGELDFGLEQEPERELPDLAHFVQAWNKEKEALAVMSDEDFASLNAQALPMSVIARGYRIVAVEKP